MVWNPALSGFSRSQQKKLALIATAWFFCIGVRLSYPVLLPFIRADYGLSLTLSGLVISVLWFSYALGQLPGGMLADRIGNRKVLISSLFISAGTLLLLVLFPFPVVLFFSTALFGFGSALFGVVRLSVLSNVFPDRVGAAVGLVSAVGDLGNAILPPVAVVVAGMLVWQFGLGMVVPVFMLLGGAFYFGFDNLPSGEGAALTASFDATTIKQHLFVNSVIVITIIQILGSSAYQVFIGFFPLYLVEMKGMSSTTASLVFSAFFVLGTVVKPIAGLMYDHVGVRVSLASLVSLAVLGLLMLPTVDTTMLILVATALISAMLGRGTIALSYLTVSLHDDIKNTGLGLIRLIYMLIGAMMPVLFGWIADSGYFNEMFYLLAIMLILSLVAILRLPHLQSSG